MFLTNVTGDGVLVKTESFEELLEAGEAKLSLSLIEALIALIDPLGFTGGGMIDPSRSTSLSSADVVLLT